MLFVLSRLTLTQLQTSQAQTSHAQASTTTNAATSATPASGVSMDLILSQRSVSEYLQRVQQTRPIGQEIDPVIRTFGHLCEGFQGKLR